MRYEVPAPAELLTQGDILDDCPLPESIVDLREVHTVPRQIFERLGMDGKRFCRLATPYREHLAQHFAVTYMRIGLPAPYETEP